MNVLRINTTVIKKRNVQTRTAVSVVLAEKAFTETVPHALTTNAMPVFIIAMLMHTVGARTQASAVIVSKTLRSETGLFALYQCRNGWNQCSGLWLLPVIFSKTP